MSHLTEKEKRALRLFKERIQAALPAKLGSIMLFGSKARGDATKHSDIDVLVVMKDVSFEDKMEISGLVVDIMLETGVLLSVKKFTEAHVAAMKKNRAIFWQMVEPDLVRL